MKRNELKAIVKECLLEILIEGVANTSQKKVNESTSRVVEQEISRRRPALDYIIPNGKQQQQQVKQQQVKKSRDVEVARQLTNNDPVMSSIFADTASTTLREQSVAESGKAPVNDTGIDPMSLFENAGNWAALAFPDSPAKRN